MAKRKKTKRVKKVKTEEELANENEFLRMSLMAEFGGDYVGKTPFGAEVENMFLKQIQIYQRRQHAAPKQTVYELLGKPEYNHVNDLSDKEIKKTVPILLRKLMRKRVRAVSLIGIDDKEMYRFITEDVFKKEVQIPKGTWTLVNLIYEDFYPSDRTDVTLLCHDLFNSIFEYPLSFIRDVFAEDLKNELGLSTDPEELKERIMVFKEQYCQIRFREDTFRDIEIDGNTATVFANVEYDIQPAKGRKFKKTECEIEVALIKNEEDKHWYISQIICPTVFNPYG